MEILKLWRLVVWWLLKMKSRIIIANLIDYLVGLIVSATLANNFLYVMTEYIDQNTEDGRIIIDEILYQDTVREMYVQTLVVFVLVFFGVSVLHKTITSLLTKGITLGRWTQKIQVVDMKGFDLSTSETIIREVIFSGILNFISLLLLTLVDLVLLLMGKQTVTSKISKSQYVDKSEERKWDYLLKENQE